MVKRNILEKLNSIVFFLIISLVIIGCGSISDGEYAASVNLTGGSGKAYIESPCTITVSGGKVMADIIWSSPNYDYMIVDGKTYIPVNTEGNSEFIIPVELDTDMEIQADTTAMSSPHLIDYTVRFELSKDDGSASLSTDTDDKNLHDSGNEDEFVKTKVEDTVSLDAPQVSGLTYIATDENIYADNYAIHRYSDGFAVVSVNDGRNYLVIPEGETAPQGIDDKELIILKKPLDKIYLAASGAMCQFDAISATDNIVLSGMDADGWYIDSAKEKMANGTLLYGGKYNTPDYEMMVDKDVDLAIENTMILRTPKVQEKLEQIGIPVFIERSSYEEDPLGRCEWVKVYGLFTDKEEEAAEAFLEQKALVDALSDMEISGKKVSIFAVNANHQIVTRKNNDYFAKMVEIAGGTYLSPNMSEEDSNATQATISVEAFYEYASDADILIYNATIEDAPESVEDLVNIDVTFSDFKAVKDDSVWYTDKSMYQYANKIGTIIDNLYKVISEGKEETEFFHKLK